MSFIPSSQGERRVILGTPAQPLISEVTLWTSKHVGRTMGLVLPSLEMEKGHSTLTG